MRVLRSVVAQRDNDDKYKWKVIFDNGGTGVVLPVFLKLLEKRKKQGIAFVEERHTWSTRSSYCAGTVETIDMSFVQSQNRAFVDPNDPTVIYIAQPIKPKDSATRST